jgi:hypothetical protein
MGRAKKSTKKYNQDSQLDQSQNMPDTQYVEGNASFGLQDNIDSISPEDIIVQGQGVSETGYYQMGNILVEGAEGDEQTKVVQLTEPEDLGDDYVSPSILPLEEDPFLAGMYTDPDNPLEEDE